MELPPHSREAEDAVLGDCLEDGAACAFAISATTDDDFYCNRIGIEAVRASFEKCGRADIVLVMNYLKRAVAPGLEFNSAATINAWKEKCSPVNVQEHCRLLKEYSTKRTLSMLSQQIERDKFNADESKIEFLEKTAAKLRLNSFVGTDDLSGVFDELKKVCAGELRDLGFPGCRLLARTCCMTPHSVVVLCGNPGASKSFFVMELLWRWCLAGHRVSSLNLEKNSPFHGRRAMAQIAGCANITNNNWCEDHPEIVWECWDRTNDAMQRLYSEQVFQTARGQSKTRKFIIQWIRREIARGVRILLIDPITIMSTGGAIRFREEEAFFDELEAIISAHSVTIILVTHPKNATAGTSIRPAMNNISGSASFTRFTDTVLWLESHEQNDNATLLETGGMVPGPTPFNRTMHVLKAKLGPGESQRVGFMFSVAGLTHKEIGYIPREAFDD